MATEEQRKILKRIGNRIEGPQQPGKTARLLKQRLLCELNYVNVVARRGAQTPVSFHTSKLGPHSFEIHDGGWNYNEHWYIWVLNNRALVYVSDAPHKGIQFCVAAANMDAGPPYITVLQYEAFKLWTEYFAKLGLQSDAVYDLFDEGDLKVGAKVFVLKGSYKFSEGIVTKKTAKRFTIALQNGFASLKRESFRVAKCLGA